MKNITFCILMLYGFAAQAQLIVSNTVETPAQLVQNVLVDASVTPTNLKFNGSAANANMVRDQAAHFTTNFNPTNLGLNAGVMLSTGNAQLALGPNNSGSATLNTSSAFYGADADLASLTTNNLTTAAVLEFDFVATGLELNFDYVFASEEYPEFTNTGFNDVFGFFLSGPGLSGPYSGGAVNIALVPSTTVPITINNVNNGSANSGPCEYCTYYVANGTGATPAANPSIQYDGFTTVLRATSALQCGGIYHIKLAISNVGDPSYDSAVFLKNFKIKPLELLANNSNVPICPGVPVAITSGVDPQDFIFVWTKDTAVLPGEDQPTLNIPASNTTGGLYTLTYYTAAGCLLGTADFNLVYYPDPLTDPAPINLCTPLPPPYDLNDIDPTVEILNGAPAVNYDIHYYYTQAEAEAPVPTAGIPTSVLNDFQLTTTAVTIWGRFEDLTASGCIFIKQLVINAGTEPSGTFSYPGPFCDNPSAAPVSPTTTVTPGGTYNTSSAGLIVNPTTGQIDLALSSPGNYTVNYHLPASGTCPDFDVTNIPVVITTAPAVPIVTSPVVYCQGETAAVLTANGTNLLWYTSATGGTGDPVAPTPSTLLSGNTDYYVSQSNGCEGGRSVITVTVNPIPAAPTFTAVAPYCQNAPALPLTANGTNLLWYTTATGGVGNAVAPTPSTATAGLISYYVTQTVTNCESPRAQIDITTIALPAAPGVTSPIGYCQNDTPAALTAIGNNLLWYAAATGGVGNATAPLINTAGVSSTTYYVSQTVSGCEGPRAAITVNVTTVPAAPGVSTPLTYCQNETAAVLSATGTNLLWYAAATGGVGNATAPTPSTIASGSTTYYVSQTSGSCEGPRAAIVVDVTPTPPAPGVAPLSYCQNVPAAVLTATGSNLLWYTTATAGAGTAVAPTPVTTTAGTTTYYVTQTVNNCESPRASLAVVVIAPPAAPGVVSPVSYCNGVASSALTAAGSNLLWYATATGGIGNATAPTPSTATVGGTIYYVSQTVNGCEGPRAAITVNVTAIPAAPSVTSPLTYCQNETAPVLSAVGSNLLWYATASGGTGNTAAPIPNTTVAGSRTYYVSQTVACEGPRAAIVVNVTPTPALPGTAPITYCQNDPAAALTATGSNLLWYAAAIGGTGSAVAPTPVTTAAATTTYYVTQTVNACESPRAALVITVNPLPATPTGTITQPNCITPTGTITLATGTNLQYSIDGGLSYQASGVFAGLAPSANYTFIARNTLTGCVSAPSLPFNITAAPTFPVAPGVTSPVNYCQDDVASALTATGNNLLWYTAATGGTGNTNAPIPNTTTAGSTTYYVSQTVGCEGPRAAIIVNIRATPLPVLAQDGIICFDTQTNTGTAYTLFANLSDADYDFEWFVDNSGTFDPIPLQTQSTYSVTVPGTYGVRATNVATGCVSDIITAPVGMTSPPLKVEAIPSEYFADLQTISVNVTPPGVYEYQLDNGAWQNSNVFVDVLSGSRTINVRNACGSKSADAYLINYPKFFTPNGDGYNDTWNIFALKDQDNAKIYIFDRYGKLLKEISPSGKGWDGSFNSQGLPSTDYWFIVHYEENKISKVFKSHFALKR